jgi:hypothetical protein
MVMRHTKLALMTVLLLVSVVKDPLVTAQMKIAAQKDGLEMASATEKTKAGDAICPVTTRKLLTARKQQPLRQCAEMEFATGMKRMKLALKTDA